MSRRKKNILDEILYWRMKFLEKVHGFVQRRFERALDDYYGPHQVWVDEEAEIPEDSWEKINIH